MAAAYLAAALAGGKLLLPKEARKASKLADILAGEGLKNAKANARGAIANSGRMVVQVNCETCVNESGLSLGP